MYRRLGPIPLLLLAGACGPTEPETGPILTVGAAVRLAALPFPNVSIAIPWPVARQDETPPRRACPADMVLVEGRSCTDVRHRCEEWIDPPGKFRRCRRYHEPAECVGDRERLRFCIDRDERVPAGEVLPRNHVSFVEAERACEAVGRRACRESEWVFACEGEAMRPYPYGFVRDPRACNADHVDLADGHGRLRDLRAPPGAHPRCTSPFGVRDLSGNLEELVARDDRPGRPAMKGAHWLPGRNHCRARQTVHGSRYSGVETGFRCCRDAGSASARLLTSDETGLRRDR